MHEVIVLGSGPAGLTAAIYLARANLAPLVIEGNDPGGQLMITTDVENFPGFPEGILGPELIKKMRDQAMRFGTVFIVGEATKVTFGDGSNEMHKVYVGENCYEARVVVIATGASAMWLGLDDERRLLGKGVSACATCDGFFFRNKEVAVVGGGDTAIEEALFLTRFASKVYVIHRRDSLRASKIMQERALKNEKISFVWNSEVVEIKGEHKLEAVVLRNALAHEDKSELVVQGLFVAIGHKPNSEIFSNSRLVRNEKGYIMTEKESLTEIPGVFVAGDVADHEFRQAVTAAGSGCKAAILAERYLEGVK
jgi:thioredoxin reductase (NADPH)